jgi:VCBS repeat-containing protein
LVVPAASQARPARAVKVVCVIDNGGALRYAAKASRCKRGTQTAVKLPSGGPLPACRTKAGRLRAVTDLSECANRRRVTLPGSKALRFCVAKKGRAMRLGKRCRRSEFKAKLAKHRYDSPTAAADAGTTDEDTPLTLDVLANDTGPGSLRATSLETTGVQGTVSLAAGQVVYDPAGGFGALRTGTAATETFTYRTTNGVTSSAPATVTVTLTGNNDAPNADGDGGATTPQATITLPVLDNDSDPDSGDTLHVASLDTSGTTGAVTISGDGTSLRYDPSAFGSLAQGATATDTFSYRANDGAADSAPATVTVTISGTGGPVVVTTAGDTANAEEASVPVDPGLTITDPDSASMQGATVRISGGFEDGDDNLQFTNQSGISGIYHSDTGVLDLTGAASVADYETALRSIAYVTSSDTPGPSKTVEFKVTDGSLDSNAATKGIAVTPTNDAPFMNPGGGPTATFTEDGPGAQIAPLLTVSDPDSTQLAGATVAIVTGFSSGDGDTLNFTDQNGITGTYDSGTGVLTLTGSASQQNYQDALRSITFSNTSDTPSTTTRSVSFQVTDGSAPSGSPSRQVNVAVANDPPQVTTSAGTLAYTEGAAAATIDAGLTLTDPDDTFIESAQVSITSDLQPDDELQFTPQFGITGAYNPPTGVLQLTGTATEAEYQTVLRSVRYRHTGDNPSASKTVEFKPNDGSSNSNLATRGITVTPVNDAPTVTTSAGQTSWTGTAVAVDPSLTVADPDDTNIESAQVRITTNSQPGDELQFTNQNGITGNFNSGNNTLTLTGTATVAQYQAALRSVKFDTSQSSPLASKTVEFKANDGSSDSNAATKSLSLP